MFSSMMGNEFSRIDMTCTAESLIPSGPGYNNPENQVCTLPGSKPGSLEVSGSDYIRTGFAYDPNDIWRNFGIVMGLVAFFLIMNVVLGEVIEFGMGGNSALVYQKPNKERKELNEKLVAKREAQRSSKSEAQGSDLKIESKRVLTWENLTYDVPVPGGNRRLLNNVFGYVKPGQLTALMGASGAGKTTLLDVLASRKNIGVIGGDILVDGKKPGKEFQRSTSYAEQLDVHEPTQTVREALRFSADLRQPFDTPQEEKYAFVEEMITLLELEDLADSIIGWPEFGLTVEQRKRVTIGVELAAKPELLLFLDEPTSGLDSQSAFNIVRFLKKLANAGQAILCTIHQPNSALFENFDRLLLLQRGGRCVYFGDIGKDANVLRDYLKRHGAEASPTDNVAEYMLEAVGAGSAPRVGDRDWADIWEESPEHANVKDTISQLKEERKAEVANDSNSALEKEYASPISHQLKVTSHRTNLALWRSPNYLFTRLFNHVVIAIVTGLTYLQLDNSRSSLQYKVFIMFQVTVLPALILSQVEAMYHVKRGIFFRESSSKMYNTSAFAASMLLAELPYVVLCAVAFFLPLYYMPGFTYDSSRAGYQFLMILITEFFSITLAQALSSITPSTFISSQLDPFLMITFSLFCGVTIPFPQMPDGYKWLYQLDPFTRLIGGMVTTALHDLDVKCASIELNKFTPANGSTCEEYMRPFFNAGGNGYIVDPSSTAQCDYCAYSSGDQFYTPLGMTFDNRWRDLGIYLAFCASNIVIIFVAVSFPPRDCLFPINPRRIQILTRLCFSRTVS